MPRRAVAVSAPHRQDALSACRDIIDQLKERVPLWKKELYEGGEAWMLADRRAGQALRNRKT